MICGSASVAESPPRIASRPRGPYSGSTIDWVAMAPTSGSANGHSAPTDGWCVCTATPSEPVSGSRATIE